VGGFFPDDFSDVDVANYTVRYVKDGGQDSERCLQDQPYPPPLPGCQPSELITYCQTVGYSLLGQCVNNNQTCIPSVQNNLVVFFCSGTYLYGEKGVKLYNFTNLIISKVPGSVPNDEVVFSCPKRGDYFNNFFIFQAVNVGINDIVFSNCGPRSPGATIGRVHNTTMTNCEFR